MSEQTTTVILKERDALRAAVIETCPRLVNESDADCLRRTVSELRDNWIAARDELERVKAELVEAKAHLIAGDVYERLDTVNYWKMRAEQAEAATAAAITQRNEAERLVNENADMVDKFVCLFQIANQRKRVRQAEIRTMIRKLAQAEADARALAEFASISAIVADVEFGHGKMERITALITKYLEAKNEQ